MPTQGQKGLSAVPKRAAARRSNRAARGRPPTFCVVGIGASAGGFDALVQFLEAMPATSGMAFIIVQHLSPSPRSLSAELFSRHTAMVVSAAEDGLRLQADHVYTSPAESDLRVRNGVIRLSRPTDTRGRRFPVDHLFSSLAQDQRERAIGIILSGTGTDGTIGLKAIVAHEGMALVQAPESAQYDGMPRSAIATGLVTQVLPIAKMPRVLQRYSRHTYVRKDGTQLETSAGATPIGGILELLHAQYGQTFTGYKPAMLTRRIERRMGLLGLAKIGDYAKCLRRDAAEAGALIKDLLIGVTEFFRDREAWKVLDTQVLRPLIAKKLPGEPVRAWVAGAGSGEEAYTLAILILDRMRRMRKRCPVQIFGTDTNHDSLNYARGAIYPLGIAGHVPANHLKRYFQEIKGNHHYQVAPEVRECVIFGEHNLMGDPPFSRVDLVTCRNLLIYLQPEVQQRLLLVFHFALRLDGHLFLGTAETVGLQDRLYQNIDRKWRLYQRIGTTPRDQLDWGSGRAVLRPPQPIPEFPGTTAHAAQTAHLARSALLDRYAPAAVLINSKLEVLYSSARAERFLRVVGRKSSPKPELRLAARIRSRMPAALRRAQAAQRPVMFRAPPEAGPRGRRGPVNVEVIPMRTEPGGSDDLRYVVAFHDIAGAGTSIRSAGAQDQLKYELRTAQEDLRSAVSQLRTSNEELRSAHEETMSINEELQSMNEELESSKEELQSVNEELNTVNTQLQHKVSELEVANSDLRNLLASNEVATVCLDHTLRIKWFTPATLRLFHLLPTDVDRPIADLSPAAKDPALLEDARAVLQTGTPRSQELEIQGVHLRRVVPYRDESGRLVGVVVTFADITDAKRTAQQEIEAKAMANRELEQRVRERTDALGRVSRDLALAEVRERQAIARDLHDGIGQELNAAAIKLDLLRATNGGRPANPALDEVAKMLERVARNMRSLTSQLSPPVLEQLGLIPALEWLAEKMQSDYQLEVHVDDDQVPKVLDGVSASILYRAVRELLINAARHAQVGTAKVTARGVDGHMTLQVTDLGTGFDHGGDSPRTSTGLGLATLRERITFLGGKFTVESERGRGTVATIEVPLQKP